MRYYVDTCIWLDLLEDRTDGLRPLGEFAFQFIKKTMKRRDTILYSELTIDELLPKHTAKEIEERCFKHLRAEHLLKKAEGSTTQLKEIENIAKNRRLP